MNILFVNDIPFNPIGGGLERVTDILTKEQLRRGHTIYYLYCKLRPKRQILLDYQFPVRVYNYLAMVCLITTRISLSTILSNQS